MATIEIKQEHSIGRDAARAKAEEIANGLKDRFALDWRWAGDSILFEAHGGAAKGAKGTLVVTASTIEVNVDLPLLLRPLKSVVESKIRAKLDRLQGGDPK